MSAAIIVMADVKYLKRSMHCKKDSFCRISPLYLRTEVNTLTVNEVFAQTM